MLLHRNSYYIQVLLLLLMPLVMVNCLEITSMLRSESAQIPGDSSRQCECWIWPTCISNCTVNPILKVLFENEHKRISKLKVPFVVIFPFQVRRQKNKKIYTNTLNKQGQYKLTTKFWVQLLNGEDVQLKLQKSKIFGNESMSPNNYLLKYYQKSGKIESNNLKKCFYTGTVFLDQSNSAAHHSYVAVDTCDGLRGIIQNKGKVFGILPMKHPNSKDNEPIAHFIYSETNNTIERVAKNLKSFWHMFDMSDSNNINDNLVHVVPVSLIIDHTLMKNFQFNIEKATHFAISLLNAVTKSFMSLKQIELQLASVELWNVDDKFPISKYIKTTLNDFLKYRLKSTENNAISNDHRGEMSILLSGVQFNEEVEYFSVPDSVCTKRSMSVVQVTSKDEVYHVSRLVSLAISEMFGINSFPCPDQYECSSKIVLSKGDETRLKLALLSGLANCLKKESTVKVVDTCGNGKLDRGEECDTISGSEPQEKLNCCDNKTCMVANFAQCNGGECCSSNCTFHSRARICRPSKDQCDIPEFCNGDTNFCPKDLFLENGNPCNKGNTLCYQGRCPTRDSKCQALWGQKSKEANQHCYSTFNLMHINSCGSKVKCTPENHMCGVLHCQGGSEFPNDVNYDKQSEKKDPFFIDTYLKFQNKKIHCKYLNNVESAYVEDGTECGIEKYCFGKTCSRSTSKIVSQCPKDIVKNNTKELVCFNKGICTNVGICLCYPGWSGPNCSVPVNESSFIGEFGYAEQTKNYIWAYFKDIGMYKGSLYQDKVNGSYSVGGSPRLLTTVHLIIIIGSVIGILFILLTLFMVCYKGKGVHKSKRSDGHNCNGKKNYKGPDKYDPENYNEHITEDGTRIIGRKQNTGTGNRKDNDVKYDSGVNSGGKRRGRRHRRRSSNGSSNRRLCRDNGDGNESIGAVSDYGAQEHDWNRCRPGGAQSDNDVNSSCIGAKMNDDLGNSIEKIIKFGNMPSYKEDKLNRSVNNSPSTNTNIASISQDTDSSLLTRSSDPLLANISSPSNSESQSLLRTPTSPYAISQQCNNFISSIPPALSTSPLPITGSDKKDPMSFTNKTFSPPFGLPAPALFPSIPYSSTPIVSVPISVSVQDKVFDLSFKQPEKGILKNKSSGDLKEIPQISKTQKTSHSNSKKNKHKHHCGTTTNDSNSATSPSSASQSSLSSCDSNSSTGTSSSSSSSASSATSSLVTPPHGRKTHHKQKVNNRRSQNNPLPAPPTILCNAGNQTDEFNNNIVAANTRVEFKQPKPTPNNGEEEIEECDEEDCEECMKARAENINKYPPETLLTSNSSAYDIVGSTDDGYHHYNPNNLRFNQDLSVHYDCHSIPQVQSQSGYILPVTSEEHSEQNSETEVDSHLQMLMNHPSHFYPQKYIAPVPFPDTQINSDPSLKRSQAATQYNQPYTSLNPYPYYYVSAKSHLNDPNIVHDNDDINSEVSISAYCRVPQTNLQKLPNDQLNRLNPGTLGSDHFSSTCYDGASNDGTIEGSDTSSLPDAHCDLLNLANLGIGSSRPNPMLNCLFRGQSTGKKNQDHVEPSNNAILPSSMWSPSRNDNRSPGHLPPPNPYTAGSDYLA